MAFSSASPCLTTSPLSSPSLTRKSLFNFRALTRLATSNLPDPPVPPDPPSPFIDLKSTFESLSCLLVMTQSSLLLPPLSPILSCGPAISSTEAKQFHRPEASQSMSGTRSEVYPELSRKLIASSLGGFPFRIHLRGSVYHCLSLVIARGDYSGKAPSLPCSPEKDCRGFVPRIHSIIHRDGLMLDVGLCEVLMGLSKLNSWRPKLLLIFGPTSMLLKIRLAKIRFAKILHAFELVGFSFFRRLKFSSFSNLVISSLSVRAVVSSPFFENECFPKCCAENPKNFLTDLFSCVAVFSRSKEAIGLVLTFIGSRSSISTSQLKVTILRISGFAEKTFLTHLRHALDSLSISRDELSISCLIESIMLNYLSHV